MASLLGEITVPKTVASDREKERCGIGKTLVVAINYQADVEAQLRLKAKKKNCADGFLQFKIKSQEMSL